jgi:hypothetical protein
MRRISRRKAGLTPPSRFPDKFLDSLLDSVKTKLRDRESGNFDGTSFGGVSNMLSSRFAHIAAFVIVSASLSTAAQAANIGIDWYGGNGTGDQTQMLPGDIAGVIPHGNWNSFLGTSGTMPLNLDDASASGATLTWANSPNDWDSGITEATSANHKMMLGYIDTNDTSITNVGVTGLPASFTTPGYLIYIYTDGDNGTNHRAGRYEVNGVSQWGRDAGVNFTGTFTQGQTLVDPTIASGGAIDNVPQAIMDTVPAGNYLIFGPYTGADFTLNVQASVSAGGTNRAALNGLQIVAIPEPTTVALFAIGTLGGLVFVARRRTRRA